MMTKFEQFVLNKDIALSSNDGKIYGESYDINEDGEDQNSLQ